MAVALMVVACGNLMSMTCAVIGMVAFDHRTARMVTVTLVVVACGDLVATACAIISVDTLVLGVAVTLVLITMAYHIGAASFITVCIIGTGCVLAHNGTHC